MVKDHSNNNRRNPLLPFHGLFFLLAARDHLCAASHRQEGNITAFVNRQSTQFLSMTQIGAHTTKQNQNAYVEIKTLSLIHLLRIHYQIATTESLLRTFSLIEK